LKDIKKTTPQLKIKLDGKSHSMTLDAQHSVLDAALYQ
jgi:hypothetical protein